MKVYDIIDKVIKEPIIVTGTATRCTFLKNATIQNAVDCVFYSPCFEITNPINCKVKISDPDQIDEFLGIPNGYISWKTVFPVPGEENKATK